MANNIISTFLKNKIGSKFLVNQILKKYMGTKEDLAACARYAFLHVPQFKFISDNLKMIVYRHIKEDTDTYEDEEVEYMVYEIVLYYNEYRLLF